MPQPVNQRTNSWSFGHEFLATVRPDCLVLIGRTAIAWTGVETGINSMLAGVLGRTSRDSNGGRSINPNWIARTAISQAETIRIRLKIVDAILDQLLEGHNLNAEWNKISAQLLKRARERNTVLHTNWAWSEDLPHGLINADDGMNLSFWTLKDFQDVIARIDDAHLAVHRFQGSVLDAIHDGHLKRFITPDMILN